MTAPNVWTQMDYVPPRGQCNHKQSVISPKCPCLRFMLHPLKSASSYECDGCGHHASFHNMENKAEDEVRKRWEQEAKEKAEKAEEAKQRPKKRVRAIEFNETLTVMDVSDATLSNEGSSSRTPRVNAGRGTGAKRLTATERGRSKIAGRSIEDRENSIVELD